VAGCAAAGAAGAAAAGEAAATGDAAGDAAGEAAAPGEAAAAGDAAGFAAASVGFAGAEVGAAGAAGAQATRAAARRVTGQMARRLSPDVSRVMLILSSTRRNSPVRVESYGRDPTGAKLASSEPRPKLRSCTPEKPDWRQRAANISAKLAGKRRSSSTTRQMNEPLLKMLCHSLRVLVQLLC